MDLHGKNICLICPKFYGYEGLITEELQSRGATVTLIYENLEWIGLFYRIVYAYFPQFKRKIQNSYYLNRLRKIVEHLDCLFVVKGSSLSPAMMDWIRDRAPKSCRYIMYQWDTMENNKAALDIVHYFDTVFTFDSHDAETNHWIYRPLFYIPKYTNPNAKKDIDILFICALHLKRAEILNKLKAIATEKGYNLKTVMHLSRLFYYKYKYINKRKEIVIAENKDLIFKPLTITDSYGLYARSKVVVDYTNTNQSGFTMRTIESLGNHCKLITNNQKIKNADFYNEDNIFVYSEEDFTIPEELISTPYEDIPDSVSFKYSLQCWLDDIMI